MFHSCSSSKWQFITQKVVSPKWTVLGEKQLFRCRLCSASFVMHVATEFCGQDGLILDTLAAGGDAGSWSDQSGTAAGRPCLTNIWMQTKTPNLNYRRVIPSFGLCPYATPMTLHILLHCQCITRGLAWYECVETSTASALRIDNEGIKSLQGSYFLLLPQKTQLSPWLQSLWTMFSPTTKTNST